MEIDKSYTNLFMHKACFNSSRLIVDSIYKSEDYTTIKKIFHINLLYFPFAKIKAPLYHGKTIFREVDKKHPMKFSLGDMRGKIFDLCDVFSEYFVISVPLFNDIIRDELDEWLYVVKHSEVKKDFKSPYMKKVAKKLDILKMTTKERIIYRAHMSKGFKDRDYISFC
nr:PD-(D/E)XK nuclease family transposase [Rickettsia hoogstraalii]